MNCKQIQKLLPLYVAAELEGRRAELVSGHVRSCAECASSVDEYRETREMLRRFEPPAFSESVYAGIRQQVLRDIGRESPESRALTLPQLVASLFRPRLSWAVTTALLIVASMFVFYFIGNRSGEKNEQHMANDRGAEKRNTRNLQPGTAPQRDHSASVPGSDLNESGGAAAGTTTSSPKRRLNLTVRRVEHSRRLARASAVAARSATDSSGAAKQPPLNFSVTSKKTLRLEIQTLDRNIRIIWFSHPSIDDGFPRESAKGI